MKKTSLFILTALIIGSMIMLWRTTKKETSLSPSFETIIVGTNTEFQPFSFKEGDTITGFDIELMEEIGKRLNKKIIFKDMPFEALIPEIQLGNVQVAAGGITPTEKRAQRVLFTQPHLTGDQLA